VTVPVAILAGGRATRLGDLAKQTPKSLMDIAGRPFAAHQLDLLRRHGIHEVVFCIGHLGEQLIAAIGDGSSIGMRVRYSSDGDRALGTGGAIRKAAHLLGPRFFVLYGDSYLDCDYQAIARAFDQSRCGGLMTVLGNDGRWDRSNVAFQDGRIVRYDKVNATAEMRHIDYGLGMFDATVFEPYPPDRPFDLVEVYQDLLARNQLAAFEVTTRFYEIGGPTGLEETRQHLS
jgi:NDP-sugar pyrophosphorylase family protein